MKSERKEKLNYDKKKSKSSKDLLRNNIMTRIFLKNKELRNKGNKNSGRKNKEKKRNEKKKRRRNVKRKYERKRNELKKKRNSAFLRKSERKRKRNDFGPINPTSQSHREKRFLHFSYRFIKRFNGYTCACQTCQRY